VPDALVAALPEPASDSLEIPNPIIVVEVLSPSTARIDATTKLRGYFEVPSVQHYLIVDPEGQTVTHHKRGVAAIETRVISEGALALDPPGLEIHLADIFAPA
jgi:Uma2 family endonuclease